MCMVYMLDQVSQSEPVHAMKAYGWGRGIAPLTLNFSTGQRWVVSFMPWPLYFQGKNPATHWIAVWVGPRASLGSSAEVKPFYPCQDSKPILSSSQLVAVTWTTPSQLQPTMQMTSSGATNYFSKCWTLPSDLNSPKPQDKMKHLEFRLDDIQSLTEENHI
jgi:hypothetical protein